MMLLWCIACLQVQRHQQARSAWFLQAVHCSAAPWAAHDVLCSCGEPWRCCREVQLTIEWTVLLVSDEFRAASYNNKPSNLQQQRDAAAVPADSCLAPSAFQPAQAIGRRQLLAAAATGIAGAALMGAVAPALAAPGPRTEPLGEVRAFHGGESLWMRVHWSCLWL